MIQGLNRLLELVFLCAFIFVALFVCVVLGAVALHYGIILFKYIMRKVREYRI